MNNSKIFETYGWIQPCYSTENYTATILHSKSHIVLYQDIIL